MTRRAPWLAAASLLVGLAGCGVLPVIMPAPVPAGAPAPWEECAGVFPSGKFNVVHALEVSLPRLKKKAR